MKKDFTRPTRVVDRVTEFVLGVNPNFKYPHMLISTIIEGAHLSTLFFKAFTRFNRLRGRKE